MEKRFFFVLVCAATLAASFSVSCKSEPYVLPPVGDAPTPAPDEPDAPPAWDFAGDLAVLLEKHDYDGALALFDRLEKEQSAEAAAARTRILKSSILLSARRLDEARRIAEEILSEDSGNTDALYLLARIEGAAGNEKEEKALLQKIVKSDETFVPALAALGTMELRENTVKSIEKADGYFDRTLALENTNYEALVGKTSILRIRRKFPEAVEIATKAVELYPRRVQPLSERARVHKASGQAVLALADLDAAAALDPNNYWIAYDRGTVLLDLNNKKEALAAFSAANAINGKGSFVSYVYTAGIKLDLGDWDGALADFTTLAAMKSDYFYAQEGIGIIQMRKKNFEEAAAAFAEAYKLSRDVTYAELSAVCALHYQKPALVKPFLAQALRSVPRESGDYWIVRLFQDFSGDIETAAKAERETDLRRKARYYYYLAKFYELKNNDTLARRYHEMMRGLNRRDMLEWRLNEWALESEKSAILVTDAAP